MPRSVNTVASKERRKRILKLAKGYWGKRKNVWTVAKNTVEKATQARKMWVFFVKPAVLLALSNSNRFWPRTFVAAMNQRNRIWGREMRERGMSSQLEQEDDDSGKATVDSPHQKKEEEGRH